MKYTSILYESSGKYKVIIAMTAISLLAVGCCLISGMSLKVILAWTLILLIVCGVMVATGLRRNVPVSALNGNHEKYDYMSPPADFDFHQTEKKNDVEELKTHEAEEKVDSAAHFASEFLFDELQSNGFSPIKETDNSIIFRYQGGYFRASNLDREIIRVIFPRIFSICVAKQDFLCRVLNRINGSYSMCRLTAIRGETDGMIEVHGYADFYYTSSLTDRLEVFEEILTVFFLQQRSLLLAAGIQDAEEIEDGDLDYPDECETAYKDISLN